MSSAMFGGGSRRIATARVLLLGVLAGTACDYNDAPIDFPLTIRVDFEDLRDLWAMSEISTSLDEPKNATIDVFAQSDAFHEGGWSVTARVPLDRLTYAEEIELTIVPPETDDPRMALLPGEALVGPLDHAPGPDGYRSYAKKGVVRLMVDACYPYILGSVETPDDHLRATFAGTVDSVRVPTTSCPR